MDANFNLLLTFSSQFQLPIPIITKIKEKTLAFFSYAVKPEDL